MAFRKKVDSILELNPDILVVLECECPEKLKIEKFPIIPTDYLWKGENLNKGVGVFSFSNFYFNLEKEYDSSLKYIIPIKVTGRANFNLFAIWAQKEKNYTDYTHNSIIKYSDLLDLDLPSIWIGDFNSNTIWDKKSSIGNHSKTVEMLRKKNIISVYHDFFKEPQGSESQNTFYMYHHEDKGYHIDHCFTSNFILPKIVEYKIGNYLDWKNLSDHVPIMLELKEML